MTRKAIWVASYRNRHGEDVWVFSSEDIAYKVMAEIVLDNLSELNTSNDRVAICKAYQKGDYSEVIALYNSCFEDNLEEEIGIQKMWLDQGHSKKPRSVAKLLKEES